MRRPKVSLFFRFKNPQFFSLEKVFENVSRSISENHSDKCELKNVYMPTPNGLRYILSHLRFARRMSSEVNHITGDIHYIILALPGKSFNVLTIHDCVLLKNKSRLSLKYWVFKLFWFVFPVMKADLITVISENTKKELIHFTGCKADKIKVIPNFVPTNFRYSPKSFNSVKPRILFVGITPNKNLLRLAEALKGITCLLEIIGKPNKEQLDFLQTNSIDFITASGLSEDELFEKYCLCDLLAFPTTYEGFGLPILEAQATGRPVLTSDLAPMNAIAAGGAVLIDPYLVSSIRQGVLKIIENQEVREEIVAKGLKNVERYKLDNVANEYRKLYNQ